MTTFEESNIRFVFDDTYNLLSSDNQINVSKVKQYLQNTKDVDFFGFYGADCVFFMEVKNFRRCPVETIEDLSQITAQKLRDMVAIVAGAARNTTNESWFWQKLHRDMTHHDKQITYLFWLEEDLQDTPAYRGRMRAIADMLKQKCKWLTTKVSVQNIQNNSFDGINATFLPNI